MARSKDSSCSVREIPSNHAYNISGSNGALIAGDGTGQQSDGTQDLPVSNVTRFCRCIAAREVRPDGKEIPQIVFYQVRCLLRTSLYVCHF